MADKTINEIKLSNGKSLLSFLRNKDNFSSKGLVNQRLSNGKYLSHYLKEIGYIEPLVGYQMKYLYFFDKELEKKFKFVEFDKIPNEVRMYKGLKRE